MVGIGVFTWYNFFAIDIYKSELSLLNYKCHTFTKIESCIVITRNHLFAAFINISVFLILANNCISFMKFASHSTLFNIKSHWYNQFSFLVNETIFTIIIPNCCQTIVKTGAIILISKRNNFISLSINVATLSVFPN